MRNTGSTTISMTKTGATMRVNAICPASRCWNMPITMNAAANMKTDFVKLKFMTKLYHIEGN